MTRTLIKEGSDGGQKANKESAINNLANHLVKATFLNTVAVRWAFRRSESNREIYRCTRLSCLQEFFNGCAKGVL